MHSSISADCGAVGSGEIDGADRGFVEHTVSKYDTLAGVAIKYGVEVADIKRMNGLVTDLQMFALRSLQIPLPGKHSLSCSLLNGSAFARDIASPKQKASSGSKTCNFYGLKPPTSRSSAGSAEFEAYKMKKSIRKSRTVANDFLSDKGLFSDDLLEPKDVEADGFLDSYGRHWLKTEFDSGWETPEKVLRDDNDASSRSSFSTITGKGLALRAKSASRATLASDDAGWLSSSSSSGDSPTADVAGKVHKSFSLPCMQDQDQNQNSLSSLWSNTMWSFKPDLQSLSASALTKPLLEGLPIVARKIKAALD